MTPTITPLCRWKDLPWLIGTAALYALLAKAVLTFYSANGLVTIFWPGAGLALAAVLLGGRKYLFAIFGGAFAGALWTGKPADVSLLISAGATLEPLLGAWLLARGTGFAADRLSLNDLARLLFPVAIVSPAVCASIGVGTLALVGSLPDGELWRNLAIWWMGDTLGIVVVAPILLAWRRPPVLSARQWRETLAVLALAFLIGQIVFLDWFDAWFGRINYAYWVVLVVAWAAIRLGLHVVLLIVPLITLQALVGAARSVGFFAADLAATQLFNFWAFTMIVGSVGTALAALLGERREAEGALRRREAELRQAQQLAGLGSWRWDVTADRHTWSDEVYRIYGRDAALAPAVYPEVARYFTAESWARLSAAVEAALTRGAPYECEAEVVRPDGERRWIVARGEATRDDAGAVVELHGTVQDVTERKRLEAEARERARQQEEIFKQQIALQTASAIAHELNQPLVAISAYNEVALRALRKGAPDAGGLAHAINGSFEQAQRAGRSLHELLRLLQTGETEVSPFDVNDTIRQAIALTRERGLEDFNTVLELEPGLPPVTGNHIQTEKVLVNLLINGIEAMRASEASPREITVTVRSVAEKDCAQVTVRDSGPGVDSAMARKIFEPFFTTKPRGLGFGLAISRTLIEAQGGQLWVDPEDGPGAVFHFTLPFADD